MKNRAKQRLCGFARFFCLEVKKDESKSFAFSCLCDFFSLLLQKKKYGEIENI